MKAEEEGEENKGGDINVLTYMIEFNLDLITLCYW